jgi:hypothetical protein
MSAKRTIEQIEVAPHDLEWLLQRARLLFLLGMENGSVSDFGPVDEKEIGDLSPKSTEFPDFDTFFRKS